MNKTVVEFKTVSPLFEMERDGIKPFTTRLWDTSDKRFNTVLDLMDFNETFEIQIINPETNESFIRTTNAAEWVLYTKHKWVNIHWKVE